MTCFLVWILAGCEHLFFREELPRASFAYAFQPSIPFEPVSPQPRSKTPCRPSLTISLPSSKSSLRYSRLRISEARLPSALRFAPRRVQPFSGADSSLPSDNRIYKTERQSKGRRSLRRWPPDRQRRSAPPRGRCIAPGAPAIHNGTPPTISWPLQHLSGRHCARNRSLGTLFCVLDLLRAFFREPGDKTLDLAYSCSSYLRA